ASSSAPLVNPTLVPSAVELAAWQKEIDGFDGGFRPTGSPAHEGYIQLLEQELTSLGVTDVHAESYGFTKWTPASWSLTLDAGVAPGPVPLSGYVPYSGETGPFGVTTGLVYLPNPWATALSALDPGAVQSFGASVATSFAAATSA